MVSEIILAEFRKTGVKVISADGGIDLTLGNDDPTGKLVRQILAAVSEFIRGFLDLAHRPSCSAVTPIRNRSCATPHVGFGAIPSLP
jgi:hypothetical protein